MKCKFCLTWNITQAKPEDISIDSFPGIDAVSGATKLAPEGFLSPEQVIQHAKKNNFALFDKKELLQLVLFHVPSLITVNAVISGFQSQEIIKGLFLEQKLALPEKERNTLENLISSQRFRIPSYLIYSALSGTITTFDLTPDLDCMVCKKPDSSLKHLLEV